jgi:rhamnosyltransferase subunit B
MRVLCVSAPLAGHLDWGGYLATARELARRGHRVLWASGRAVQPQIEDADVGFQPLAETGWRWPPPPPLPHDPAANPQAVLHQKQLRALDQWLDTARVAAAVQELAAVVDVFHPDLILSEMFVAAAGLVAEQARIPLVVMGWPAPALAVARTGDAMAHLGRGRLDDLLARFDLTGANWTGTGPPALCAPHLHLTYWSPRWFTGVPLGSQTRHVGGLRPAQTAPPPGDLPSPDAAPWVLITLGTSFNADPAFFIAAAHAAQRMGCLPLLALGAALTSPWVQAMRARLPHTAVVAPRLEFAAVLPHVAAAIHHGGAGTTHALITHAIPQIVVPHAADQARQAQGVLRCQVGLVLPPKEVTVERLTVALAQTLPDRAPLRVHAQTLQAEFDALGGIPTAADTLESFHRKVVEDTKKHDASTD